MDVRRVALFSAKRLLGESLERILSCAEGVEIVGVWLIDEHAFETLIGQVPDVVVIADDEPNTQSVSQLTAQILERFADLPVIQVALDQDTARVYSAHTLPARSADLLEAIRNQMV